MSRIHRAWVVVGACVLTGASCAHGSALQAAEPRVALAARATRLVNVQPGVERRVKTSISDRPVVLVAGIFDTGAKMIPVDEALADKGFSNRFRVDLVPSDGSVSLTRLAPQLKTAIEGICVKTRSLQVDLVAYSMGAIVSRYYLQELGGLARLAHFVTISAPHNGTLTGFAVKGPGPYEMRTGSEFLAKLNGSAEELKRVPCTSLWTPFDLVIVPANSSVVPWAKNRSIGAPTHPGMLSDKRVQQAVADALLVKPDTP